MLEWHVPSHRYGSAFQTLQFRACCKLVLQALEYMGEDFEGAMGLGHF